MQIKKLACLLYTIILYTIYILSKIENLLLYIRISDCLRQKKINKIGGKRKKTELNL